MSLENVRYGRVVQAILIVFGISLVVSFMTSCLLLPVMSKDMMTRFSDLLKTMTDTKAPQDQVNKEIEAITRDFGPQLNLQYAVQWTFAVLITFWAARRTARQADSPEQAVGYGILIGLGVAFSYGVFCVLFSIAFFAIRAVFFIAFFAAGYFGGKAASGNLQPGAAAPPLFPGLKRKNPAAPAGPYSSSYGGSFGGAVPAGNPETFYNMGVMAAAGGRREEARQHFTRVLQMQPRHLPAWLQLANLSDTPEQAWNYIQQARSINPTDPAVLQAVELIWPQVAANAARQSAPRPDAPRLVPPPGLSTEAPTMLDLHTVPPATSAPGTETTLTNPPGSDQNPPVPPPPAILPPS